MLHLLIHVDSGAINMVPSQTLCPYSLSSHILARSCHTSTVKHVLRCTWLTDEFLKSTALCENDPSSERLAASRLNPGPDPCPSLSTTSALPVTEQLFVQSQSHSAFGHRAALLYSHCFQVCVLRSFMLGHHFLRLQPARFSAWLRAACLLLSRLEPPPRSSPQTLRAHSKESSSQAHLRTGWRGPTRHRHNENFKLCLECLLKPPCLTAKQRETTQPA